MRSVRSEVSSPAHHVAAFTFRLEVENEIILFFFSSPSLSSTLKLNHLKEDF